ncbi:MULTISPECIES: hypothetical protein [Bacillus cereus group]|uniref:hypothetical protein n=1 Tax=Bacillus cereus group TaxID=86661 RepID=UPI001CD9B8D6|nr:MULTISPECIES: hypothetical protein [Bacillus cereus group]MEA1012653.1 hypothetical protein [Bacillus cereus]
MKDKNFEGGVGEVMTLFESLMETFYKKPYNEIDVVKHLETYNLEEIEPGEIGGYKRIYFKEDDVNKTLFIKVTGKNIVKHIQIESKKLEFIPSNLPNLGCLVVVLVPIGLCIWFVISVVTTLIDGGSTDVDTTPNNPYTEDFDGDGLGGTKEDHDIYHKNYK